MRTAKRSAPKSRRKLGVVFGGVGAERLIKLGFPCLDAPELPKLYPGRFVGDRVATERGQVFEWRMGGWLWKPEESA